MNRTPNSYALAALCVVNNSLLKHLHSLYDKIAFLPDTNSSEYMNFSCFTLVFNENEKIIKK